MTKNPCAKTRKRGHAYEVWVDIRTGWRWEVLKKWQSPEKEIANPFARWFCDVYTEFVPDGEMGDTYVSDIKGNAQLISTHAECPNCYK